MANIYLSAALFTAAERAFNRRLCDALSVAGHSIFLPQDIDHRASQAEVFRQNREAVERTDLVLAVLDGPDVDSGVAWEIGYAHAHGKPVLGLRTDFRNRSESHAGKVNLMLLYSVDYLEDSCLDWEHVVQALNNKIAVSTRQERSSASVVID